MQIIVLGMHRSGTSAVARILNLMGAYFAPERMELPATEANPKGYWERRDVVNLNEELLSALGVTWDKISQFDAKQIPMVCKKFESLGQEIILGLDAHRPWMLKDPRLCLLLPFWLPLLETPLCVYVHRDPIQIAQSLKKRDGLPIQVGIALWEKYTLQALIHSARLSRTLVSYHDLMTRPLDTVKSLYDSLQAQGIQGLRLPSERELFAFIEPSLFHEQGNEDLQNAYINQHQLRLVDAFNDGSILSLLPVPPLSQGAIEILEEHESHLLAIQEQVEQHKTAFEEQAHRHTTLVAEYESRIAQNTAIHTKEMISLQQQLSELEQALYLKEQDNIKYQTQVGNYRKQWLYVTEREALLKEEIARLNRYQQVLQTRLETAQAEQTKLQLELKTIQEQLTARLTEQENMIATQQQQILALNQTLNTRTQIQEQDIHKLLHWIVALEEDINATFNSLTWRSGNVLTQMILKLLFKTPGLTAQDHIQRIMADIAHWRNSRGHLPEVPTVVTIADRKTSLPQPAIPAHSAKAVPQNSRDYARWIKNYDTLTTPMIKRMKQRITEWDYHPFISIVMPTFNTKEKWLRIAIESIQQQIYPHWELCIADDASTLPYMRRVLEEYAHQDSRIKLQFRENNGHISAASNTALELVTGEYVTFVDHDDQLPPHALFWVAQDIIDYPNAKLWYSDEDKMDEQGERADPYFKSDWNGDLFLSHNLITHLAVYRTDVIQNIGGFREGYEGAQDYDLALRAIEQISPLEIRHIPRILYHWRIIDGSTAMRPQEKPYAIIAAQKAIMEHLERRGILAVVTESSEVPGTTRVQYTLPPQPPRVTLIIPTYNAVNLLKQCVESILTKTDYPNYEILVIDNASDDPETLKYLQQLSDNGKARVFKYPYPFNYADMNNKAVAAAEGEIIGLLNNDIEVINPEWLTEMVSHAIRPEVGVVGARLWYPNETLQHGGVILGIGGVAGHAHKGFPRGHSGYCGRAALIQNFSAVTGACMVMRKDNFFTVGGLDAENLAISLNDIDLCLKMNHINLRMVWTPYAELYHHESATRGYEDTPEKRIRFEKERDYMKARWGLFLMRDPAYSPNLTLETQDFAFAWPPRVVEI
jgi:glycosyltransferase involved in cell wall biosynthesis